MLLIFALCLDSYIYLANNVLIRRLLLKDHLGFQHFTNDCLNLLWIVVVYCDDMGFANVFFGVGVLRWHLMKQDEKSLDS